MRLRLTTDAFDSRARRGVAAAEFAILAPFLGALIMGMCEMGRAVMAKDILTNAARKSCRTAATNGKTYQNAVDDANNILTDNHISTASATITVQVATYTGNSTTPSWGAFTTVSSNAAFTPNALDKVSVKVSVPATSVLWFAPVFMPTTAVESETLILVRQG
jgi:Flp pilus assembly protein TadG